MKNILLLIAFALPLHLYAGIARPKVIVLAKDQYPAKLAKMSPSCVYVFPAGYCNYRYVRNDTVTDLQHFTDSGYISKYRLVFNMKDGRSDSVAEYDSRLRKTQELVINNNDLLTVRQYSIKGFTESFTINYQRLWTGKYANRNTANIRLADWRTTWFRDYDIYSSYERSHYTIGKVWLLSVGIDSYGAHRFKNCVSDAQSFAQFFEYQARKNLTDTSFQGFVLLNEHATKDSILHCLDYIIAHAGRDDYFIFNFSGITTGLPSGEKDSVNDQVYFRPYSTAITNADVRFTTIMRSSAKAHLISLTSFDEKIQRIQAGKQLFVVEAGPSENFKTEFLKGLTQDADRILNANRVIMVPSGFGLDNTGTIQKGPINYFITSIDSSTNIFDLFNEEEKDKVAFKLKSKQYTLPYFHKDYFDIWFARDFYRHMREFTDNGASRGLNIGGNNDAPLREYASKRIAVLVATDTYMPGWDYLYNPIYDATALKTELEQKYGFEVRLLTDPSMEQVYDTIRHLYAALDTSSQLLLYFAGHGYVETNLYDDGFIVCHDSKPFAQDPNLNSYIPFSKIRKMINKLPAKQIMVVMDICHGGTFDNALIGSRERSGNDNNIILNLPTRQRLATWSRHKSRILLASVGNKPALDGAAGRHSPFASLLLICLRNNDPDNILTAANIYSVLQQQSLSDDMKNKIEPYKSTFGDHDPEGEFVFIPAQVKGGDVVSK